MKWYYILILGIVGPISGDEHDRVKRQFAVSPLQPGFPCPPAACPQDCGAQFIIDPQTGCRRCQCDPNDNTNQQECPSICPANYDPVCGSDGKTYSNQCALSVASCQNPDDKIVFLYKGKCGLVCNPNPPCPADCATVFIRDPQTGCQNCRCRPSIGRPTPSTVCNLNPPCPADCATTFVTDPQTGCKSCRCRPTIGRPSPSTVCNLNPPCPADCATTFVTDPQTGCKSCRCRPTIGRPAPTQVCNPNPPCPSDCATVFIKDPQTGCRTCRCRPNIGRPFPNITLCNPNPPCPADCAKHFVPDPQTGCKTCTCQTNTAQVGNANVSRCNPGDRWIDKCNSCFCPPNGIPACTLIDCSNAPLWLGPECRPGDNWTKQCNRCTCLNSKPVCTLKDCSTGCEEGTTWTEDCKHCFCVNGVPGCTRTACPQKVPQIFGN